MVESISAAPKNLKSQGHFSKDSKTYSEQSAYSTTWWSHSDINIKVVNLNSWMCSPTGYERSWITWAAVMVGFLWRPVIHIKEAIQAPTANCRLVMLMGKGNTFKTCMQRTRFRMTMAADLSVCWACAPQSYSVQNQNFGTCGFLEITLLFINPKN